MSYPYKNLKTHKNFSSGIAEFALIAPFSWFDSIAVPTAPFAAPGDEVTIKTAHTFKTGKGFMKVQLAPQKNKLEQKSKGDLGANGEVQMAEIFIPGSYAEAHEQIRHLKNTPLIVLLKDSNMEANMYHQLGREDLAAWLDGEFNTSNSKDGVKGFSVKINYDDGFMIYDVTGGPTLLAD